MLSLFRKRPPNAYRLPCGRWADGLAAYRRLVAGGCLELLDARRSTDPSRWDAAETQVCDLARAAFDVPPLDPATGRGYDDATALAVLDDFLGDFCSKKWSGTPRSPT